MNDRRKFTLKGLRINNSWTIAEASIKYGVSSDTVKNYESYKTFPDVPIIENILKATGLKYDDIIFLPINYGKTVETQTKEVE